MLVDLSCTVARKASSLETSIDLIIFSNDPCVDALQKTQVG